MVLKEQSDVSRAWRGDASASVIPDHITPTYAPGIDAIQSREAPQDGGFARSRGPEEHGDMTGSQIDVYAGIHHVTSDAGMECGHHIAHRVSARRLPPRR